jgi:hypothetical protein
MNQPKEKNSSDAKVIEERKVFVTTLNHPKYCVISLGIALVWTAIGGALAYRQASGRRFLAEWYSLQGFFLVGLGTWLVLIVRSGTLKQRVSAVVRNGGSYRVGLGNRPLRLVIIAAIGLTGTASLIAMGFEAKGSLLAFMWFTCLCVCLGAAVVTLHSIDLVSSIHNLQFVEINAFLYSPARTPELRALVGYFTSFTLLMTVGYA